MAIKHIKWGLGFHHHKKYGNPCWTLFPRNKSLISRPCKGTRFFRFFVYLRFRVYLVDHGSFSLNEIIISSSCPSHPIKLVILIIPQQDFFFSGNHPHLARLKYVFHQPRFPWNKGIPLTKLPPFAVRSCEVAIIWPDPHSTGLGPLFSGGPRIWFFQVPYPPRN